MNLFGIILAGGSGTRLWPISRKTVPKQLLALMDNKTFLQKTIQRILPLIPIKNQCIVTNSELYFQVKKQLNMMEKEFSPKSSGEVIVEPLSRNTAPAIIWAASRISKNFGNDSIMVVLPSDHMIARDDAFAEALKKAVGKAQEGALVTFGIQPSYPETGYGYIKTSEKVEAKKDVYHVERFVEKPDLQTAGQFLLEGKYLWNSGIFVFHVGTLLEEAAKFSPEIYNAFTGCEPDNIESVKEAFESIPSISIDHAIMEHTDNAYVVYGDFGWSDVGSWKSLYDVSPKDDNGNVVRGENISIETKNSLIYGRDRLVVTIGLEGIALVDTDDALLVSRIDQTYKIKEVIDKLNQNNSKIHIEHLTVDRPWGNYKIVQNGYRYKIKKITVFPKNKLSRHYHFHRSEHWIVVKGTAKVTQDDKELFIYENESYFIPKGTLHKLENPGTIPLEIIEIQSGSYLEEDDIVRVDDDYRQLKLV